MYTVKIPKVGTVKADTLEALGDAAWKQVHGGNARGEFYGASQVGSKWPVNQDGARIGDLSYNGRFWPAAVAS